MIAAEIRKMPDNEIEQQIEQLSESLFRLRFRRETEQLEDLSEVRSARRDIARLKTVLRERQLGIRG